MSNAPVKVAVTGAAGQIGYSLLFRIASGALLGPDTPVELRLLEITPALGALEGVVMELDDCAFPTLAGVEIGDDAEKVFDGANLAMLVGAMPRKEGMDRADLLAANGAIFTGQGAALNKVAADDIKILVTGNPANTNALIAMSNAPDIPRERFNALTRLDHNRAKSQLAAKLGVDVTAITDLAVWGNHDDSMYPDLYNAKVNGQSAASLVDQAWITDTYIPTVATRGGAIIKARGLSSAASAANATHGHRRPVRHRPGHRAERFLARAHHGLGRAAGVRARPGPGPRPDLLILLSGPNFPASSGFVGVRTGCFALRTPTFCLVPPGQRGRAGMPPAPAAAPGARARPAAPDPAPRPSWAAPPAFTIISTPGPHPLGGSAVRHEPQG